MTNEKILRLHFVSLRMTLNVSLFNKIGFAVGVKVDYRKRL
jgi:hypothetical protein